MQNLQEITGILSFLEENNINVWVEDNFLEYDAPIGTINDDFITLLKDNKAEIIKFLSNKNQSYKVEKIESIQEKEFYELSNAQRRLWIIDQLEKDGTVYSMPTALILDGKLRIDDFKKAYSFMIERHESLRTVFVTENGDPKQKILENIDFDIEIIDLRDKPDSKEEVRIISEKEMLTSFNLEKGPLIRFKVVVIEAERHLLLCNMHHIVSDGLSMNIFVKEFLICYNSFRTGNTPDLKPLGIQYKDYSAWQNNLLKNAEMEEQRRYWLEKLSGELPVLDLPTDNVRPSIQTFNGKSIGFNLSKEIVSQLNNICMENEVSLFMMLQALVKVLFYRYIGQTDIIVGSPIAGRVHEDLENQIGFYVNTLSLRDNLEGSMTFIEFLVNVKKTCTDAFDNQDYPFDKLVDDLDIKRDLSRSPLFDVMLVLQSNDEVSFEFNGLNIYPYKKEKTISKFDMSFNFSETADALFCDIEYNTDIYSEERINRMVEHIKLLIFSVLKNPESRIKDLEIIPAEEKKLLLNTFNDTKNDYPSDKTLVDIFEQQVDKNPNNIAVIYEGIELTYRELNEKANIVGNYLRENYTIKPDDLVGVIFERSEKMLITLLGILKSGAAYLPIDSEYPEDRIQYMLKNSNPKLVLSDRDEGNSTNISKIFKRGFNTKNPIKITDSDNLAYVLYTSGSTGKPKGVMVSHKNITSHITKQAFLSFSEDDILLLTGSISFDISTFEIWSPLVNGASIIVTDKENTLDINNMGRVLSDNNITILHLIPQLFNQLAHDDISIFQNLKCFLIGGDLVDPKYVCKLKRLFPSIKILHMYGPTENTTFSTYLEVDKDYSKLPLGKPLNNSSVYILDSDNKLLPYGVIGEICVSGEGVARGYLNDNLLTSKKFIVDKDFTDGIIYKTGDLGQWNNDGYLEFLGRIDNQIKIRGIRIELQEVEEVFSRHENIEKSVVVCREINNENQLVAYYQEKQNITLRPSLSEYIDYFKTSLPGYMIPTYFIPIDSFPLTTNGKIDRNSLPEPEGSIGTSVEFVAPRNEIEKKLVTIWMEILGYERIGIHDNFFDLGGHSLKATRVISHISKDLEVNVSLREIFDNQTIETLSEVISSANKREYKQIDAISKNESYIISNAQRRLWVLDQYEENCTAYNIPAYFLMKGELNTDAFEQAYSYMIERHESLRTVFITENGEPRQKILNTPECKIELIDIQDSIDSKKEAKKLAENNLLTSFNLETGPLVQITVLKVEYEKHLLLFNMHHIISDGWSMNIFIKEFLNCYNSFNEGVVPEFKPLRIHYKDFSAWQNESLNSPENNLQREYWLNKLSGELPVLDLPSDRIRPVTQTYNGNSLNFSLPEEINSVLSGFCLDNQVSMFMMLQTLVKVLFHRYTGQTDIIIGSPISGRSHEDLENQIGIYVNILALRDTIEGDLPFKEILAGVKQTCIDAFENQNYPFDRIVEDLDIKRDLSRSPLFDVMVVLQNNDFSEIEFDGLNLSPYKVENLISKFDIAFNFVEVEGGLICGIEYNTDIYYEDRIKRLINHFKKLVSSVFENPDTKIKDLEIIPEDERNLLLNIFNDTKAEYPADKTIIDIFEEQVEMTPDNIAVVFENVELTYRELNNKANNIGHYLRDNYKIKPDDLIGVFLERSEKMIIAILGILKSGAAYVPIDPEYPENRIEYILNDSGIEIILTEDNILENYSFSTIQGNDKIQTLPILCNSRMQIEDFNALPIPDRSLIDYEKYNQFIGQAMVMDSIAIQTTRGCPFGCIYCHRIWPKRHIVRSAENIYSEIHLFYKMGVKRFVIIDDIFNFDKNNSQDLFKLIIKNKLDIQMFFPNGMRGDLLTKDYIDLMVKAGVVNLALALESASPRLQKMMKKNLNLVKLRDNIEYIAKKYPNVILELFTMHGFPSETEEESTLTLDFIKSIKWIHFPYVHILKIYPGTDMAKLAIEEGVSNDAIIKSSKLAYHEIPETLPFKKEFTIGYQADFLNEYFLNKERLLHVLPYQMKILTEEELIQKYNSYLPVEINSIHDLLNFSEIKTNELSTTDFLTRNSFFVKDFNKKLRNHFPVQKPSKSALKILLLDMSQYFDEESNETMLYDVVEPPLGLMYLLTYLNKHHGNKIDGKIAKSRIDFNNYGELKILLEEFNPDIICIRTLSFYKDFFHKTIAKIKLWGNDAPIIIGGPYATSDYKGALQDSNIKLAILGEGEETLNTLITQIINNNGIFPSDEILTTIDGISFIPEKMKQIKKMARSIVIKEDIESDLLQKSKNNLPSISSSSNLAYVIYTSGSTGKPKGALIENRNVVRLLFNEKPLFNFSDKDIWTIYHSFCFDFSVWEMYGALLLGGKAIVLSKEITRDFLKFSQILEKEKVTVLNQTPTAFYNLSDVISNQKQDLSIRYVIFGGEALNPYKLQFWYNNFPDCRLINMFGITETTVHVTYKEITEFEIKNNISNLGKPIPTLSTYVLDGNQNLLPIGVAGELCVSGEGVCRGYLNRDDLNLEKFIENPFNRNEKLYRSGDSAYINESGELIYIGRIDNQVQLRGFRVELGEIKDSLQSHNEINSSVVIVKENNIGEKQIVVYYVSDIEIEIANIRSFLEKSLPDYMIPSFFLHLESLPLTTNGKLNRNALPEPDGSYRTGVEYVAPRNDIEEELVKLWQDVLGVENIGLNDNFFDLGGNSLNAIKLISKINVSLASNIKLKDLYSKSTIGELSKELQTNVGSDEDKDLKNGLYLIEKEKEVLKENYDIDSILPTDYEDFYPLSKIQQGMVFFSLLKQDEPIYHDQFLYFVSFNDFNADQFRESFMVLLERHSILRTSFDLKSFNEPYQIVHKKILSALFEYIDISSLKKIEQENRIRENIAWDLENKFMAINELLWRMKIFFLGSNNYSIMFSCHHAILDGWSVSTLISELISIYGNLNTCDHIENKILKADYKKYVAINLSRKESDKVKTFWMDYLKDYSRTRLPFNFSNKKVNDSRGSVVVKWTLDRKILEGLNLCCRQINCTLKELLLSAHIYLLYILTGEKDIITGTVSHDRPAIEDSEKVLGCFLNTIPVRFKVENKLDIRTFVSHIKSNLRTMKENELFLSDIAMIVGDNNRDGNPLFDTIFNYTDFRDAFENVDITDVKDVEDFNGGFEIDSNEMTNTFFDLETSISDNSIKMQIKYAPSYFYPDNIDTAYELYLKILNVFITDSTGELALSKILGDNQDKYLSFNNTDKEYPINKTISSLFEEQVKRTPKNTALIFKDEKLTYEELNEKSNQLASLLVERGIRPGDHVGISSERCFEMIIGMYAILKAGGVYVPIDPDYPETRKKHIIENSSIDYIVQDKEYNLNCEESILIDTGLNGNYSKVNLQIKNDPNELAYIIYTSGSTGKPKGVMIKNHSIVNLINWVNTSFHVNEKDRLLFITSMCFDLSVYDIFGILASGGSLVIAKQEQVQNPSEIYKVLKEKRITFWDSVPSTFNFIIDSMNESDPDYIQNDLRLVFMSGDWIPVNLPEKISKHFPNAEQVSLGGATEGTVWSIYYKIDVKQDYRNSIPYGKPIDNNSFYILDDHLNILPDGVAGELYIGGVGVATGYMNDMEKTDYSFVDDIFTDIAGNKMYRTGDYGRMLPDGNIEFLGRLDDQVKIRGFRIELGEIENTLLQNQFVSSAFVDSYKSPNGGLELIAYYVAEKQFEISDIKSYLGESLPNYMIPSYFIYMDSFPLTPNGKIDRKALPEISGYVSSGVEYVAPRNEIEDKLVQIWQEILGIEKIGVNDNFFDLGGHSLIATKIVFRIQQVLSISIQLTDIFKYRTIQELADYIEKEILINEDEINNLINLVKSIEE